AAVALTAAMVAQARPDADPRIADLVRAGAVRVAMFPPQYTKHASTGEIGGWAVELARALAARMGVAGKLVEYPGPDQLLEGLRAAAADAGFLVNSPNWAELVDFSSPFLQQDFTLPVP